MNQSIKKAKQGNKPTNPLKHAKRNACPRAGNSALQKRSAAASAAVVVVVINNNCRCLLVKDPTAALKACPAEILCRFHQNLDLDSGA